jgi:hypothetical protein
MSASLRKRPKCCVAASPLFDYLVGGHLQRQRHFEAERLSRLEVDPQLELDRLDHREIGRLSAVENLADVDAAEAICVLNAGAIADQAAGNGLGTPSATFLSRLARTAAGGLPSRGYYV